MRPPLLFVALSAALLGGCYSAGDGVSPPLQSLYFPTGVALDVVEAPTADPTLAPQKLVGAKHLFVASSDFDLQYKSSALAAYDLEALRPDDGSVIPFSCNVDADCGGGKCDNDSPNPSYFCVVGPMGDPCRGRPVNSPADQLLSPGRCQSIVASLANGMIADTVEIGAFATDVVFKKTGAGGDPAYPGRLFLPVRGDATLHWVDVGLGTPGHPDIHHGEHTLNCGQMNNGGACDEAHRIGDDPGTESPNDLRQVPEPFAIAVDDAGENIAITNQTTGSVSLYVNHWEPNKQPQLVYSLSGLPTAPVGIAALPTPKQLDPNYEPGFLAVYRNAPRVDLLRVRPDPGGGTGGYAVRVLTYAGSAGINANSIGSDSRGIVIDDHQRKLDYASCYPAICKDDPDLGTCVCPSRSADCLKTLQDCLQGVHQPSVFVSNRAPASLLVGAFTPDFSYSSGTSELPSFSDSIPLNIGASRVVLGQVRVPGSQFIDEHGQLYALEQRVFVVCFDSRRIFIYDPARHVIDSIVTTGRGPFALAIDEARGLGYVAHFTDSYLGVISLDQRFPQNYAAIVASVGVPSPPRASK